MKKLVVGRSPRLKEYYAVPVEEGEDGRLLPTDRGVFSTDINSFSQGVQKLIDGEKDWEVKIPSGKGSLKLKDRAIVLDAINSGS